jgi:hypothetical protein
MARRVFYSFHYKEDNSRASLVRNIGVVEGNAPAKDNDWETITKGGDEAIKRWINAQIDGRSCSIVLIGANTAGRKWINYEIGKSWNEGKGLLGIYIHNLKDLSGSQARKGTNPFATFTMDRDKAALSTIVKAYDPPFSDSKAVYNHISQNLATWIEDAVRIRNNY